MSEKENATIIAAYVKAKSELAKVAIKKSATNPHFKSKYAELKDYQEAVDPVLAKHGLAITQHVTTNEGKVECNTKLWHENGESMESGVLALTPDKSTPQGVGSAITYARRYSLSSFLGLAAEDDDGNAASSGKKDDKKAPGAASDKQESDNTAPIDYDRAVMRISELTDECLERAELAPLTTWFNKHNKEIQAMQQSEREQVMEAFNTAKEQIIAKKEG